MVLTQQNLNLAVIGNCALNALIDEQGSIVFSCWPEPDKDPLFNKLLDNSGVNQSASFDISLKDQVTCEQNYIPNTPIIETLLEDEKQNKVKIISFFPRFSEDGKTHCPKTLIRIIEIIKGEPEVMIRVSPRFKYNTVQPKKTLSDRGISYKTDAYGLYLDSDIVLDSLIDNTHVRAKNSFSLTLSDTPASPSEADTAYTYSIAMLNQSIAYWTSWTASLTLPTRYQHSVIRAAIGLKLCWHQETGAILAALTLGLPAEPNSNRNWDYRYSWLRDSYYSAEALYKLGDKEVLESYKNFVKPVLRETALGHVQCMYDLHGKKNLKEKIEPGFAGYRSLGPVLSGNKASEQVQLDCFGHVLNIFALSILDSKQCSAEQLEMLESSAQQALKNYQKPDSGFWELRGTQRVHTNSAIVTWSAMDNMEKIYKVLNMTSAAQRWAKEKEICKTVILQGAWSEEDQAFMGYFGGRELDTTILCFINVGMINKDDSRLKQTVDAMRERLNKNGFILPHEGEDDFGERTCGFNFCTFWYSSALHHVGYKDEAVSIYEGMLNSANKFGYLSEVIDPDTKELWGNYPQAYSLIGIIDTAISISS